MESVEKFLTKHVFVIVLLGVGIYMFVAWKKGKFKKY